MLKLRGSVKLQDTVARKHRESITPTHLVLQPLRHAAEAHEDGVERRHVGGHDDSEVEGRAQLLDHVDEAV